jgi:hypothetical protein
MMACNKLKPRVDVLYSGNSTHITCNHLSPSLPNTGPSKRPGTSGELRRGHVTSESDGVAAEFARARTDFARVRCRS